MTPDLYFSLLGRVRATRAARELPIGSPQQQAMMAVLVMRRGWPVSMANLIDALWAERPPPSAVTTVRTYAWRLRRVLEPLSAPHRILLSVGDGYQLNPDAGGCDLERARALTDQAAGARTEGDIHRARVYLAEALSLWNGEPLAGVPGPFAERQRVRLSEFRLTLLEEMYDVELACGNHRAVLAPLSELAAAHPLREGLHATLMRALYAAGRQAEALAVFQRARRALAQEYGVDPGPDLEALHERVLRGDPSLMPVKAPPPQGSASAAASTATASVGTYPVPAQLPPAIPDFIGRASHVEQLCHALAEEREIAPCVIGVTGMGGVGKTTLVVQVAHLMRARFPDGQLFVDLHGTDRNPAEPGRVLAALLISLGVPPSSMPDDVADRCRLFRSVIDNRRLLIVLDNARDSTQIRDLLPGSAGAAVLITSRSRLFGLPLTAEVALEGFQVTEALSLLDRFIGTQRLAAEREQSVALVAACGLLPLAVRIVAAKLAARPGHRVEEMVIRLRDEKRRWSELKIGNVSLESTLELGHRQLSAAQRRAFRLLAAVNTPRYSLGTAAALLGHDEVEAESLLEALVDGAMLESPGAGVYQFHDLLGPYARRMAEREGAGEIEAAVDRLLDFLLATACNAFGHAVPGDPVTGVLGPAMTDGIAFADAAAAGAWVLRELDAIVAAATAAAMPGAGRPSAVSRLRVAADLLLAVSPYALDVPDERIARTARLISSVAAELGDDRAVGRSQLVSSFSEVRAGSYRPARRYATSAIEAATKADDRVILRQALNDLGLVEDSLGNHSAAIVCFDRAVALARDLGHRSGEATSILNAALAQVRDGHPAKAVEQCQWAIGCLAELGDTAGTAYGLYVLGSGLHALGEYTEAVSQYRKCLELSRAAQIRNREAHALCRLAEVLNAVGDLTAALDYAQEAVVAFQVLGFEHHRGLALRITARILTRLGRTGEARTALEESGDLLPGTTIAGSALH